VGCAEVEAEVKGRWIGVQLLLPVKASGGTSRAGCDVMR
jgi:hypothetical protein